MRVALSALLAAVCALWLAAPAALDRLRLERSLLVRETAMLRATTSRPAPDYAFEQFSQN